MNEKFLLDIPPQPTTKVAIFIPGVSGQAFSDRFKPMVQSCLDKGIAVARVNLWEDAENLEQKNIGDLHKELEKIIGNLKQKGFVKIFGIGKSFGGGLLLGYQKSDLGARVLWAPATQAAKVDLDKLKNLTAPVCLIHGESDDRVPFSDSEHLTTILPNSILVPIPGADHSFKNPEHEKQVSIETAKFLAGL